MKSQWGKSVPSNLIKLYPVLEVYNENLTQADVGMIWNAISTIIEKHLDCQKAIVLPDLGTFTYMIKKIDLGLNRLQTTKYPIFILSDKLAIESWMPRPRVYIPDRIPQSNLNFSALAGLLAFDDAKVRLCYSALMRKTKCFLERGTNFSIPFPGVGELRLKKGNYTFIFNGEMMAKNKSVEVTHLKHLDPLPPKSCPCDFVVTQCPCNLYQYEEPSTSKENKRPKSARVTRTVSQAKNIERSLCAEDVDLFRPKPKTPRTPSALPISRQREVMKPQPNWICAFPRTCLGRCDQDAQRSLMPLTRHVPDPLFSMSRMRGGEDAGAWQTQDLQDENFTHLQRGLAENSGDLAEVANQTPKPITPVSERRPTAGEDRVARTKYVAVPPEIENKDDCTGKERLDAKPVTCAAMLTNTLYPELTSVALRDDGSKNLPAPLKPCPARKIVCPYCEIGMENVTFKKPKTPKPIKKKDSPYELNPPPECACEGKCLHTQTLCPYDVRCTMCQPDHQRPGDCPGIRPAAPIYPTPLPVGHTWNERDLSNASCPPEGTRAKHDKEDVLESIYTCLENRPHYDPPFDAPPFHMEKCPDAPCWFCNECKSTAFSNFFNAQSAKDTEMMVANDRALKRYLELQDEDFKLQIKARKIKRKEWLRNTALFNKEQGELIKEARKNEYNTCDIESMFLIYNRKADPDRKAKTQAYGKELRKQRDCMRRWKKLDTAARELEEKKTMQNYMKRIIRDKQNEKYEKHLQEQKMHKDLTDLIEMKRPDPPETGGAFDLPWEWRKAHQAISKKRWLEGIAYNNACGRKRHEVDAKERQDQIEREKVMLATVKEHNARQAVLKRRYKQARTKELADALDKIMHEQEAQKAADALRDAQFGATFPCIPSRRCDGCCRLYQTTKKEHDPWRMGDRWPQKVNHYSLLWE